VVGEVEVDHQPVGGPAQVGALDGVEQVAAAAVRALSGRTVAQRQEDPSAVPAEPPDVQASQLAQRDGADPVQRHDAVVRGRQAQLPGLGRLQPRLEPQRRIVGRERQATERRPRPVVQRGVGMAGEQLVAARAPRAPARLGVTGRPGRGVEAGGAAAPVEQRQRHPATVTALATPRPLASRFLRGPGPAAPLRWGHAPP
jgi:hypothetical protein